MNFWVAIIVRKVKAGIVVKNIDGPEELLVRWSKATLVEINSVRGVIQTNDTAWVENELEKSYAKIGSYVKLATESEDFPKDESEVEAINYDNHIVYVCGPEDNLGAYNPSVLIIYHDFSKHVSAGDSGAAFCAAVEKYYIEQLEFTVHKIHACVSYTDTLGKIAALGKTRIDRVLIVTHGNCGQVWLGNPNAPTREDALGIPTEGKNFVSPTVFGEQLQKLLRPGLAISIYSCNLVAEDGLVMVSELAAAARARVVFAATGVVQLHAHMAGISTATCPGGQVLAIYPGMKALALKGDQIPVFSL
ncbi:hypothetical protein R0381_001211 [Jeongeupia wiesaeckerbachi]|uniref:hypothetical protein n=1 Tax=Jeongeupia wiesaeckerbachi TaxID=3051218 RepID=UPI003D80241A